MKCSLLLYASLLATLTGCQNYPAFYVTEKAETIEFEEFEEFVNYGAKFAYEYSSALTETCTKYKQLYAEGDWRAGWMLAVYATSTNSQNCLNSKEAIQILTTLETENKINVNLLWLANLHLSWLEGQEKQTTKVNQLMWSMNKKKSQLIELKEQNKNLEEKIDALKEIETSINQ